MRRLALAALAVAGLYGWARTTPSATHRPGAWAPSAAAAAEPELPDRDRPLDWVPMLTPPPPPTPKYSKTQPRLITGYDLDLKLVVPRGQNVPKGVTYSIEALEIWQPTELPEGDVTIQVFQFKDRAGHHEYPSGGNSHAHRLSLSLANPHAAIAGYVGWLRLAVKWIGAHDEPEYEHHGHVMWVPIRP